MRILDRLPIEEEPTVLFVGAEAVTIKRYQIGVWISINDETRPFPAVLDLGHSHNLSITESQLKAFAGLSPARLEFIGTTRLKGSGSDNTEPMCGSIGTGPVPWSWEWAPTD